MPSVIAEHELFQACEIIFGPELNISRDFLEYLQASGIKTAYRKRAMETHPDRTGLSCNGNSLQDTQLFLAVQEAYENLMAYLKARENGYRFPRNRPTSHHRTTSSPTPPTHTSHRRQNQASRPSQKESNSGRNAHSRRNSTHCNNFRDKTATTNDLKPFWNVETLYSGPIPNRRLLLGHYLYYSGLITWRLVVQALIWQRTERPKIGELGKRFRMLTDDDILQVLKNRPPLKPFGEAAMHLGLLSETQLSCLIFHQKRLQKKFGEFFVEKKILRPEQLKRLIVKFQLHNASITGSTIWDSSN